MNGVFGRNTAQVEWLLGRLRELPAAEWMPLEDAHAASATKDAAEEALSGVLAAEGLRAAWFALREEARAIASKAAADYAADTGEGVRTIEHVASVNAWDGQRETSKLEVLGPAHDRGFMDAAAGALGVVMSRSYISEPDFTRFWQPYLPLLGLPAV